MHIALLNDLYQLTMAYGYFKSGMYRKDAVFHYFFRKYPFGGGFALTSGLEALVDFIRTLHFNDDDLAYLEELSLFDSSFLQYLGSLRFTLDIDAAPEGTVVFPLEPLVRVKGSLLQCQLLETPLLTLLNFPTLIATKAARVVLAADGDEVCEFGARRAQGIDGALTASRAAFVGGCTSTSNLLAGQRFSIPVRGTQAHSWIMAFDKEQEAFDAYADLFPDRCILLVDTYDTEQGVAHAIQTAKHLQKRGKRLQGIRLDSGDLAELSHLARKMLNEAGLTDVAIFASNELDEYQIARLKEKKAPISFWGVGTRLVTGQGQPALDGIYKLAAICEPGKEWRYREKTSQGKGSLPGVLQVKRFSSSKEYLYDEIYDLNGSIIPQGGKELLQPIFQEGKLVYELPSLIDIQKKAQKELSFLPADVKLLQHPAVYSIRRGS